MLLKLVNLDIEFKYDLEKLDCFFCDNIYRNLTYIYYDMHLFGGWDFADNLHPLGLPFISYPEDYSGSHLFSNIKNIPIFLVDENVIKNIEKNHPIFIEKIDENYSCPPIEFFGVYLPYPFPQILICPKRIKDFTENTKYYPDDNELKNITFELLFTLVLIHEIVHYQLASSFKYTSNDVFFNWIEESFANYMTIKAFELAYSVKENSVALKNLPIDKRYSDDFKKIKAFISGQPANYKLGLIISNIEEKYEAKQKFCVEYYNWKENAEKLLKREKATIIWLDNIKKVSEETKIEDLKKYYFDLYN